MKNDSYLKRAIKIFSWSALLYAIIMAVVITPVLAIVALDLHPLWGFLLMGGEFALITVVADYITKGNHR